jgi:ribosome-associated protein
MITHDLRVMADAMLDKKAQRVVSIDLRPLETAITDHFMICNADSTTAVSAIADNIIEKMQDVGRSPFRKQGMENNFWIILDYGDIVAHIFLTEYRNFYRLEDL